MERLTERNPLWIDDELWERACEPDCEEIDAVYRKLKDYEDTEEQGLLLRLPCKVGDSVYRFWYVDEKPYKVQTQVIRTLANLVAIMESGEFGKSVFLSLEEAEAKLKEMEENQ